MTTQHPLKTFDLDQSWKAAVRSNLEDNYCSMRHLKYPGRLLDGLDDLAEVDEQVVLARGQYGKYPIHRRLGLGLRSRIPWP